MPQQKYRDKNGFGIVKELDLLDWCNYQHDQPGEYVHIIPGSDRTVSLYRSIGEAGSDDWVKTTVEASQKYSVSEHKEVSGFYVTGGQADTVISLLTLMGRERADTELTIKYYEDNGKTFFEGRDTTEETLYLSYRTGTGRDNQVMIDSVYDSPVNRIGKFD